MECLTSILDLWKSSVVRRPVEDLDKSYVHWRHVETMLKVYNLRIRIEWKNLRISFPHWRIVEGILFTKMYEMTNVDN